jgi:hypothetical protein
MINHILLKSDIYRIEEKQVQKDINWCKKEKSDLEELQKNWEELEILRKKYLEGNTYQVCGDCGSRLHFNAKNRNMCWNCYLDALKRIEDKERNLNGMSFVERMNFNEARGEYSEPNEEEKKQIELNNQIKILPREIKERETKIEELKKKMEEETIWQKQISEERDFTLIKSVDTNKKFVEHPNIELRFFKHNRKDEWERILDKLNSDIQAKYPRAVFVGKNQEKGKQNFIYELEKTN